MSATAAEAAAEASSEALSHLLWRKRGVRLVGSAGLCPEKTCGRPARKEQPSRKRKRVELELGDRVLRSPPLEVSSSSRSGASGDPSRGTRWMPFEQFQIGQPARGREEAEAYMWAVLCGDGEPPPPRQQRQRDSREMYVMAVRPWDALILVDGRPYKQSPPPYFSSSVFGLWLWLYVCMEPQLKPQG